jgi:hypothetical protein
MSDNRRTSAFEVLLACGHIVKVDGGPSEAGEGRYFCPYGCGPQPYVEAPRENRRTSAPNPFNLKTCKLCGRRYASWGAHMEECNGPPPKKPSDA